MSKTQCLLCAKSITANELSTPAGQRQYHERCSLEFFGDKEPPLIEISRQELEDLALRIIQSQSVVTGVQPKLSMDIDKDDRDSQNKLSIVGFKGRYILKPQTERFENLPENEHLTMSLARLAGINTVPYTLVRLKSGELAYLTRRVDRDMKSRQKIHMEDMCQLSEKLTEHKYRGSYEQIAKLIFKYDEKPGLGVLHFFEVVLFSFLVGNADMHLKNFSLIKKNRESYTLSPAYDLVCSKIVMPEDPEEMALTLNAKKRRINREDFEAAMVRAGMNEGQIRNIFKKFERVQPKWMEFLEKSFLPEEKVQQYRAVLDENFRKLGLV